MASELLTCPFCNRPAKVYHAFPHFDEGWHVDCDHEDDCILWQAHGMFDCEASAEKAAAAWNRRAPSPSPAPGVVDRVLDAAAEYMIEQYGIGALHHKVDRQRIKAALASLSQPAKGAEGSSK